jgi:hypothetical protein
VTDSNRKKQVFIGGLFLTIAIGFIGAGSFLGWLFLCPVLQGLTKRNKPQPANIGRLRFYYSQQ